MGTVTINSSGVGAAQSGTVTTAGGSGGGKIMVTNDSDSNITFVFNRSHMALPWIFLGVQ